MKLLTPLYLNVIIIVNYYNDFGELDRQSFTTTTVTIKKNFCMYSVPSGVDSENKFLVTRKREFSSTRVSPYPTWSKGQTKFISSEVMNNDRQVIPTWETSGKALRAAQCKFLTRCRSVPVLVSQQLVAERTMDGREANKNVQQPKPTQSEKTVTRTKIRYHCYIKLFPLPNHALLSSTLNR